MSFSRMFFYFCLSFLGGVFIASFSDFFSSNAGLIFIFFVFILAFALLIVFYPRRKDSTGTFHKKQTAIFGFYLLVFIFGIFWEEKFEAEIFPKCDIISSLSSGRGGIEICDIHYFNNLGSIAFEGLILEEPEEEIKSAKIVVESQKIVGGESEKKARGKVLITLPLGARFNYGDKVLVEGALKSPEKFSEDFNWPEYLRKDRIYSTIYNPEIKVISSGNGSRTFLKILSFKGKLRETAQSLPAPEGAVLSAITLGDKTRLSQGIKDSLSRSGLAHITAVSGMHILVLFEIFLYFFLWLGLWRKQATILMLLILAFYILMIGFPSSAVRAGIMGGFLYLGWALGRLNQSSRAIIFAATGMVAFNPLILTRDVSFQLSFLASLGIIYLLPIFKKWAKADKAKIIDLILLTFAVQVFCLPILIFNFGQIPMLAPISNILVVPLLPFLLSAGFLYLALGTIFPVLTTFLSFILWLPFLYVVEIAEGISSLPFSAVKLNFHWCLILVFYIVLGCLILKFNSNLRRSAT